MGALRVALLCLSLALAGGLAAPASAQSFGRVVSPILTIDRDRLFSGSLYGQRINRELEAARSAMAAETSRIEQALEAEEQAITEQRATLDSQAFRALADAFDDKVQALRAEREAAGANHRQQIESAQLQFFDQIGPILGALVRARGAVMIVDSRAILLTAADVDITDAAIARIDAALGDGAEADDAGQAAPDDATVPVDTIPAPDQPTDDSAAPE